MAKGRGGGKTYPIVQKLICEAVIEKSQNAVAKESGVTLNSIQNYMKGIGEPSLATLKKLSAYFQAPVEYLRGEYNSEEANWSEQLKLAEDYLASTDELIKAYKGMGPEGTGKDYTAIVKFMRNYIEFLEFCSKPISNAFPNSRLNKIIRQYNNLQKQLFPDLINDETVIPLRFHSPGSKKN